MKSTKTMLIAALATGALLACSSALLAQDTPNTPPAGGPPGGGMRGRGGPTIEQLTTNLSLTADQIPKVQAVLDDQKQKMTDLRKDTSIAQADKRTKAKEIRDDATAKLKDILTPDQFAKYQKMMPGRRPGGQGGGAPPSTPPPTGGN